MKNRVYLMVYLIFAVLLLSAAIVPAVAQESTEVPTPEAVIPTQEIVVVPESTPAVIVIPLPGGSTLPVERDAELEALLREAAEDDSAEAYRFVIGLLAIALGAMGVLFREAIVRGFKAAEDKVPDYLKPSIAHAMEAGAVKLRQIDLIPGTKTDNVMANDFAATLENVAKDWKTPAAVSATSTEITVIPQVTEEPRQPQPAGATGNVVNQTRDDRIKGNIYYPGYNSGTTPGETALEPRPEIEIYTGDDTPRG